MSLRCSYLSLDSSLETEKPNLDVQGNLNIQITDVWNFNKNRPSLRGRLGEKYQENGELTNYGILIIIKIPQEKWQKVLQ